LHCILYCIDLCPCIFLHLLPAHWFISQSSLLTSLLTQLSSILFLTLVLLFTFSLRISFPSHSFKQHPYLNSPTPKYSAPLSPLHHSLKYSATLYLHLNVFHLKCTMSKRELLISYPKITFP
jgi:hypothetical protein